MKQTHLFHLLLLMLIACKSPHALTNTQQNKSVVQQRAQWHVDCLNNRNFDALEDIYTEDFSGWAPFVQFENKATLLDQLKRNYQNSDTQIDIQILAVESGPALAYVLLHWKAFSPIPDAPPQVLFEKDLLEIWRNDKKGNWQLARMLFFQAEEGFGIER